MSKTINHISDTTVLSVITVTEVISKSNGYGSECGSGSVNNKDIDKIVPNRTYFRFTIALSANFYS